MPNIVKTTELAADALSGLLKTITIPPCPEVVIALLAESRRPEPDFGEITRLLSKDIGLSASILKTVNSPFFCLRSKARSVAQAAALLGLKNIVNIVNGLALQRALTPAGINMASFWEEADRHAQVSALLARQVPGIDSEDAYTFGMFHDCGIPILTQRFPEYRTTLASAGASRQALCELENEHHGTDHAEVGALLARHWQLPDLLVHAIRQHHNDEILSAPPSGTLPGVQALAAISLLAHQLIASASATETPDESEWGAHGADAINFLGLDEDELEYLQNETSDLLNTVVDNTH